MPRTVVTRRRTVVVTLAAGAVAALAGAAIPLASRAPGGPPSARPAANAASAQAALGRLPLTFEANAGQAAPPSVFVARGRGVALGLGGDGATLRLAQGPSAAAPVDLRFQPVGGARTAPVGEAGLPGVVNYLRGPDPARWLRNVPTYGRVTYAGVWPGLDWAFHGQGAELEYDVIVAPGADPAAAQFRLSGQRRLWVSPDGDLRIDTARGVLVQHRPAAYQEVDGQRQPVAATYRLHGADVSFRIGAYDPARPLVIDPVLTYSTYLGGANLDAASAVALDSRGAAYVAGSTYSADFPGSPGGSGRPNGDVVVIKLNPNGTVAYTTTLAGGAADNANAIAVDGSGAAYVAGATDSTDFPTTPGTLRPACSATTPATSATEGFVAKLGPNGDTLAYSTCLGGADRDVVYGLAVDGAGRAWATGTTISTDFPAVNPLSLQVDLPKPLVHLADAFVSQLDATGQTLLYSTRMGGLDRDEGDSVALDAAGRAYVAGWTQSGVGFPTTAGAQQPARTKPCAIVPTTAGGTCPAVGFVAKFDPSQAGPLALAYSTLVTSTLPGPLDINIGTQAFSVAVGADGTAWVAGVSREASLPTTPGAFQTALAGGQDVFVIALKPDGSGVLYGTYLGGAGDESQGSQSPVAIALGPDGLVYVAGFTTSTNFPLTPGAFPGSHLTENDVDTFVAALMPFGPNAGLRYSTYLAGNGDDTASGLAVDGSGAAYVVGQTSSTNLPAAAAVQGQNNGEEDAFVAKVSFPTQLRVTTAPAAPSQILLDDVPRDSWGLTWLDLPAGSYNLSFTHVEGWTEPAPQTVTVAAGQTVAVAGAFTRRGSLRVSTSPGVPAAISVDGIPRNNWGMWTDLPAGAHEVCFGPAAGYAPPPCQNVTVTAGALTEITGTYTASPAAPGPVGMGRLRVTTSPALASQILLDGVPRDSWGLTWLELPPGTYNLSFTHVEGWTEPAAQTVTVTAGQDTVVDGVFSRRGSLRVTTSPALPAVVSVDGVPRNDWGMWTDLPTGPHTVCFGPVPGFTAPPCQPVVLSAGVLTSITGAYAAA